MNDVTLTGEEMLAWGDVTPDRWRRLGEAHPEMLGAGTLEFETISMGRMRDV